MRTTYMFRAIVMPNHGLFQHARVVFDFNFTESYPEEKPVVKCLTKVYHPNISYDGRICFNILSSDWKSGLTLEQLTNALLWLMNNPNFSSALNTVDSSRYPTLLRHSMMGKKIGSVSFEPYLTVNPRTFVLEDLKQKLLASYHKFLSRRIIDHIAVAPSAGRGRRVREELTRNTGRRVPLERIVSANFAELVVEDVSKLGLEVQPTTSPSETSKSFQRVQTHLVAVGDEPVILVLFGKLIVDPARVARTLNLSEDSSLFSLHKNALLITGFNGNFLPIHGPRDLNGNSLRVVVHEQVAKKNQNTTLLLPTGVAEYSYVVPPGKMKELLPPFTVGSLNTRTKITVHYVTHFGQNLYFSADKPAFGLFSAEQAWRMTMEDDFIWSVEFENQPELKQLGFRFLVKDDFDSSYLRVEEFTRDKEIKLNRNNLIQCTWEYS
eukprot:TRINITY_DN1743_c0_g1_i1.p1 TRINITY_DN1743_c0_g1~~TRINITY_DN1743_c0_g1_i1.p1  ORF type:complete len:437 (-),score=61.72 TRINITY_DN1743_c0_g1_i1:104-1414(-)